VPVLNAAANEARLSTAIPARGIFAPLSLRKHLPPEAMEPA
jgi:hypothetical protein